MEKSLTIQIGADLEDLSGSYSLCLAKQIQGNSFSIVWHAYTKFFPTNLFRWTPNYEIFAAPFFTSGEVVFDSVPAVEISPGQQSTLNESGTLSPSISSNVPGALRMINNLGRIFPGIRQQATGIDGTQTSLPNFVATAPALKGTIDLFPTEQIMVWFQADVQDGTMFDDSLAPTIQPPSSQSNAEFLSSGFKTFAWLVDFSQADEHTISYENQSWATVG